MGERVRITVQIRLRVSLRAALYLAIALSAGTGALVGTVSTACASTTRCGNEELRIEQGSTYLSDCRAYELVSAYGTVPKFAEVLENGTAEGGLAIQNARAAPRGERMSFASYYPQGSSQGDGFFLSTRTTDGWVSESVMPTLSTSAQTGCPASLLFSSELTAGVLSDGAYQTDETYCGHNEPSLATGEPVGWRNESELAFKNVFLRESFGESPRYRLVNRTPTSAVPSDAILQAASQDLGHVVFSESAELTQTPVSGEALYEWYDGTVRLVSILPNGKGVSGHLPDGTQVYTDSAAQYMHAVSDSGSRVFFVAEGKLFVREHAEREQSALTNGDECTEPEKACTTQVDASQASGTGGGGTFMAATGDGSRAYFMDDAAAKLTSNTVASSKQNLYEYELESKKLIDLTAVSNADLIGVSAIGEEEGSDSSYLYFVADGAFAAGAIQGEANLYVVHDKEAPEFVATLEASLDATDWTPETLSVRISPDGQFMAFDSARRQKTVNFPAGYENTDFGTGKPDEEIYLYGAKNRTLYCVSCQPDGAQPEAGGAELLTPSSDSFTSEPGAAYLQRNVLNDGTVFFQTREAYVTQDQNEATDVYEYSEEELHLLSSGASADSSLFMDASESGNDVFIATTQALVHRDTDGALSAYDVRVDGGFSEPSEASPCKGEEGCRGVAPVVPELKAPLSEEFIGPGNILTPAAKEPLSREQKLKRALKSCQRKRGKSRRACEATARKRFGAKVKGRRRRRGK